MVLQMPCSDKARVFAASSAVNKEQARQEVGRWAIGQGYRPAQADRTFTIYRRDAEPREWVLLEQGADTPA